MELNRAPTLEAISAFIQSQRALLSQTHSDIERLKQLRREVTVDPQGFVARIDQKFNDDLFHRHDHLDGAAGFKKSVDWALFEAKDPARLHMLASDLRLIQSEREVPSSRQCSLLSPLQRLVKDARRTILDPVLEPLDFSSDSADEGDELTPHERRKERERAKIRELRMRRIGEGGLTLPINGEQEDGVFIRRDLDDESGEVDVSLQDIESRAVAIRAMQDTSTEDAKQTNLAPLTPLRTASFTLHSAPPKPPRPRRSATKAHPTTPLTVKINLEKKKRPQEPEPEQALDEDVESRTTKRPRGSGKPKPETFNQAWSVSEQHLLERLLEEIPDGEKNRWAKISKAMNGRRTARQVASRVQKYFEKLKRFGVQLSGTQSGGGASSSRASSLPMTKEDTS